MEERNYPLLKIEKLILNYEEERSLYFNSIDNYRIKYQGHSGFQRKNIKPIDEDIQSYEQEIIIHDENGKIKAEPPYSEWVTISNDFRDEVTDRIEENFKHFKIKIFKYFEIEGSEKTLKVLIKRKLFMQTLLKSKFPPRRKNIKAALENISIWIQQEIDESSVIENEFRVQIKLKKYNLLMQELYDLDFGKYKFVYFKEISLDEFKGIFYCDIKDKKENSLYIKLKHEDLQRILKLISDVTKVPRSDYLKGNIYLSNKTVNISKNNFEKITPKQIERLTGAPIDKKVSIEVSDLVNNYTT